MAAHDLVVHFRDRVSASGRYVRSDDADWLDLARVDNLMFKPDGWKSRDSLRLIGFDPEGMPRDFTPNDHIIPGWACVTGPWLGDTILVESQTTVDRPLKPHRHGPPCPPPPGGWDSGAHEQDFVELDALRASGVITRDSWIWVDGATVLRVAATDVDHVLQILGPLLPRRLCVVASRFSPDDVRRVAEGFNQHAREWLFQIWSYQSLDETGQPYAHADLLWVREDLAAWADTFPAGLLRFTPAIAPA